MDRIVTPLPGQEEASSGTTHRILIADGDITDAESLCRGLEAEGAALQPVSNDAELAEQLATAPPDVVLLDPDFAEGQGLDLYREHCSEPRPGLVVCTRDRSADMRVACAEAGADHLVYKPLVPEELPLLIGNLLYRLRGESPADQWSLDRLRWVLMAPDSAPISLTYREMVILDALSGSPGRVTPRESLVEVLGFDPADYDPRRLEILIRRLRSKVASHTSQSLPLTTVHGIGYAFTAPIHLME
ncbi:response regulator transcription factor [Halomonas mongoliensis]|uniref:response regulator transcription factor n=1 Tax=Halomonas mongoliensis TaxID=321265 RepID=UPI00403A857F